MSNRKDKPETVLAKADADIQNEHREVHPEYDRDVIRFGRSVADYNAGWLACDTKRRQKSKRKTKRK